MKFRVLYTIGFLVICALMGISFYLQMYDGFEPCPLCILQRFAFGLMGIWLFLGILVYKKMWRRFFIDGLTVLTSICGILLAGRQIWLQHYPPKTAAECGVSLQYMLQALPLGEVLQRIFSGTAECTQAGWEFLHLNMAEWSLIWFILFFLYGICCALEELRWRAQSFS